LLESETVIALPAREKAICLLLAQGLETKEIAGRLGLTINTTISYIRSLYQRLGIASRHELLARLLPGAA
jgi:DNA-binding CsgD family transcriptional regulator